METFNLNPNEYILFVWGISKRPNHYTGIGFKHIHSERILREDNQAPWKHDFHIAENRAKELLTEFSRDKSVFFQYDIVIKGDNGKEYGSL